MKKLSTCIVALITALLISGSAVPTYAANSCESTNPAISVSLPIISRSEDKAFLPVIDRSEDIASLPILEHCSEQEEVIMPISLEDFINSVEVRYRSGQVTIYYGLTVSLVTLDCNGLLIVERLPSEGIVRIFYNSSDGEFHIVDLVVSPGNTVLRELPHTDG